jgi:hypothetical protein
LDIIIAVGGVVILHNLLPELQIAHIAKASTHVFSLAVGVIIASRLGSLIRILVIIYKARYGIGAGSTVGEGRDAGGETLGDRSSVELRGEEKSVAHWRYSGWPRRIYLTSSWAISTSSNTLERLWLELRRYSPGGRPLALDELLLRPSCRDEASSSIAETSPGKLSRSHGRPSVRVRRKRRR